MYCLAERHLSSIQKAIQSAHGIIEYSLAYGHTPEYRQWAEKDKTMIVLDGGNAGDLDELLCIISANNYNVRAFEEPDLNGITTVVCFLADERIFDYSKYGKSYEDYQKICQGDSETPKWDHAEWIKWIGGRNAEIIKTIISEKRTAI